MSAKPRPALLVATTNVGKLREVRALLGDLPLQILSLEDVPGAPSVDEDGATYFDNAMRKALTIARWSQRVTMADDSGIEVDALGGAPGVHSARFAGPQQDSAANVAKLLRALEGVPAASRTARFRCVIVVAAPDGAWLSVEGVCEGRILDTPRGSGGFGYDPVFFYPPAAMSCAELPAAVKNEISHRAVACRRLHAQLVDFVAAHTPSS